MNLKPETRNLNPDVLGGGAGEGGEAGARSAGLLRACMGLTCRLASVAEALAIRLKTTSVSGQRAGGEVSSEEVASEEDGEAVEEASGRLVVLLADLATDARVGFAEAEYMVLLADLATDARVGFAEAEVSAAVKRVFRVDTVPGGQGAADDGLHLGAADDGQQQLMDLARLRHIDAFLKALSSSAQFRDAPESSSSASAAAAMQRCVGSLLEMFHDPRRAGSLIVFYLDHSPIDESLPESLPAVGKGNLALLLHLLSFSSQPGTCRDVLRLFRALLERAPPPPLARLKPVVRRQLAEVVTAMPRGTRRRLFDT
ncbi:hypothetical protein T484DRAFT_1842388 [Baffinella frigidus]|nr:hypothetical protein T484DRAFT_1842388 [Cryptophyta sp. CCMP2293]